jgi:hypothetical protein
MTYSDGMLIDIQYGGSGAGLKSEREQGDI